MKIKTWKDPGDLVEVVLVEKTGQASGLAGLRQLFSKAGVREDKIVEHVQGRSGRLCVYLNPGKASDSVWKRLSALPEAKKIATRRIVRAADWVDSWKREIRPFRLTATLDVVPTWAVEGYKSRGRKPVYLDTTMAFGTGLHETTRFLAGFLESRAGQFGSFLDVGTGSGLLAIVAGLCGAKRVDALDIDAHCLKTAAQNFARNGRRFQRLYRGDFCSCPWKKQYDFVVANLFTQDLITLRDRLCARVKPGKFLAISGIARNNLVLLQEAFASLPLKVVATRQGKKWVALLFQRRGE